MGAVFTKESMENARKMREAAAKQFEAEKKAQAKKGGAAT